MIALLNLTWGALSTMIGAIVYLVSLPFGHAYWSHSHPFLALGNGWGGLTLGWFTLLSKDEVGYLESHETGHVIQNAILGPFWIFIIALPSLIHALVWSKNPKGSYYAFFTESWANRLSGI